MAEKSIELNEDKEKVLERVNQLAQDFTTAHFSMYDANRELNHFDVRNPVYAQEKENLDLALLFLAKAKWYLGRANGNFMYIAPYTRSLEDCEKAAQWFSKSLEISQASQRILQLNDITVRNEPAEKYRAEINVRRESEIVFADDVPIVPSICPIVVLEGSSHQMGRQYVQQVVQIYGPWMFTQIANRKFTDDEIGIIKKWHTHLELYTPEILETVKGWVEAANELGILLNYWQGVQLWTGHFEPLWTGVLPHGVRDLADQTKSLAGNRASSAYLGGQGTSASDSGDAKKLNTDNNVDLCSGCCAWGDATPEGRLVAGSTTDHDCTYQATIIAFPDDGNAYIYTPFAVTGFIPPLAQYYFAGHPGMNNKGLAYVHHGGGLHALEPESQRGYGLRRGASTFHNLRYANSARDALKNELSWPVGCSGTILGSVGGFYADGNYAYICECREGAPNPSEPTLREVSFDEEGNRYNFLYANNNSVHPKSAKGFNAQEMGGYEYNVIEGWVCDKPALLMKNTSPEEITRVAGALSTKTSQGRNRYMYSMLRKFHGVMDIQNMQTLVSTSAPERYNPDGKRMTHAERDANFVFGQPWPSSTSHRLNAFTAIMLPDNGDQGIYMGCIGPANRRVLMHTPGHGYYYYDETNEFWEVRLASTPKDVVETAGEVAGRLLHEAETSLEALLKKMPQLAGKSYLRNLLVKAKSAHAEGRDRFKRAANVAAEYEKYLAVLSFSLRRFTTSQVRAKQVMREISQIDIG